MFKQAIVLRTDLGMGRGKLVAQGSHASLEAFKQAKKKSAVQTALWEKTGCEKIVLRVSSEKELLVLHRNAKALRLPCALVRDAGHTQVPAGSVTALAVGPAKESVVDKVTGELKLL